MTAYAFETITAQQALAIRAGDTLTINTGPGNAVGVVYQSYDPLILTPEVPSILVTVGDRTVKFGTGLVQLSDAHAIVVADGSTLAIGDTGDERIGGGAAHDGLYGGPGRDSLDGGDGDDLLQGNSGADVLVGGTGVDAIYGGQGDDLIFTSVNVSGRAGEAGDFAHGNAGDDEIYGGAGADTLLGGQGADFIGAGDGADYVSGDRGSDEIMGGLGADTLIGGDGDDTLQGGFGADNLSGGDGDDQLVTQGSDITLVSGGAGNDTVIAASSGREYLAGGEGRDRFEIVAKAPPGQGADDFILDWESADTLTFPGVSIFSILPRQYSEFVASDYAQARSIADEHISAAGATWVAAQVGADVIVFADTGDPADGADAAVVLVGRTLADISLLNFG